MGGATLKGAFENKRFVKLVDKDDIEPQTISGLECREGPVKLDMLTFDAIP
jgi:hypothetical protein